MPNELLISKKDLYGDLLINSAPHKYDERFKFTGKERDWETGYDFFGARYYDHRKGFWNSVDPLADKYPNVTPYLYCNANPVMLIDPDGRTSAPPSERVGETDYYDDRHNMYVNRHPWLVKIGIIPTYYINFGAKYCPRFREETAPELSPEGRVWEESTLLSLQQFNEKIVTSPIGNEIEMLSMLHKELVYWSHVPAYLQINGEVSITDLHIPDLWKIVTTPDKEDLIDGWKQSVVVGFYLMLKNISYTVTGQPEKATIFQDALQWLQNQVDAIIPKQNQTTQEDR